MVPTVDAPHRLGMHEPMHPIEPEIFDDIEEGQLHDRGQIVQDRRHIVRDRNPIRRLYHGKERYIVQT